MEQSTGEIFPQARIGSNGELLFPHRGDPPKAIEGYKRDIGDPYVFKPITKPCIYRGITWKKVCGGQIQCIHCSKFAITVKVIDCLSCDDRRETRDNKN